jgi:hypothetical protein
MLVEVARPVILILNMISLYAVFHTAFLAPSVDLEQRIWESLGMLALAGGLSLISGVIFREGAHSPDSGARLSATLPVRMFCWAASMMFVLFVVAWYLETHCIFYRDIRW